MTHALRLVPAGDLTSGFGGRLQEIIARQEREIAELEGVVDVLKGALAGVGIEPPKLSGWVFGLSRQEAALVGALIAAHPHCRTKDQLLDALPGRDAMAYRDPKLASVLVCTIRKTLGTYAILTEGGFGYRISPAFLASIKPPPIGEDHGRFED